MSYANFKATVKKVNIKPKGVQEIVLEINGSELDGLWEQITQMVDTRVQVELESSMVNYRIAINARTQEPLVQYKVDKSGVVEEVKNPEQLELEGMPEEKVESVEQDEVIDKETVDEFILSGLAPTYEEFREDILDILKRQIQGETYLKIASELNVSSGVIVEQSNQYRAKIAPLAKAWIEWKESQGESTE